MIAAARLFGYIGLVILILHGPALAAEVTFFYHTDPAGTPLAMTDASGNMVWRGEYKPFGEEMEITPEPENKLKFVGKEKDKETGLLYFGARYMEAKIGRFISPDPVGAVDPRTGRIKQMIIHDPQRINSYAYGLNNPHKYIDPDGEFAIAIAIPALIAYAPVIATGLEAAVITGVTYVAAKAAVEAYNASKSESNGESDASGKKEKTSGTTGRGKDQERLRQIGEDSKESSANRGWIKQEENQVERGKADRIRRPPGKELSHSRGREASKCYDHVDSPSNLQDKDLHRTQHKFDNFGRKNKERP